MPKLYSPQERKDIQDKICRGVSAGLTIGKVCAMDGMPARSIIYEWLVEDEAFSDTYARAREARADARSERIDDLAEEVKAGQLDHNAARVIIDAEKWQASKENQKRYGDKLDLNGSLNVKLDDAQVESRLAHLIGKAGVAGLIGGTGTPEGPQEVLRDVSGDGASQA